MMFPFAIAFLRIVGILSNEELCPIYVSLDTHAFHTRLRFFPTHAKKNIFVFLEKFFLLCGNLPNRIEVPPYCLICRRVVRENPLRLNTAVLRVFPEQSPKRSLTNASPKTILNKIRFERLGNVLPCCQSY